MTKTSEFPDPVYARTVLAPLFEGVKAHHADHLCLIDRAHLVMLAETGILSGDDAAKIAATLHDIDRDIVIDDLEYTGEYEDFFFLREAELKARLGDLGGALHTARSRNDMDHTLFKLALQQRTDAFLDMCRELIAALSAQARREADTLIVAYTHGQPAQPTTFGHYLAAVIEVLLRDMERLEQANRLLDLCPMGAAAITTTGFPIDRSRMAALLGFAAPSVNSYGCIAGVDYVTGLYSALKLVFLHLGRVVQDLAIWSSFEQGQLRVPDALVQISSIMPQKRNPVPIEHLRHLASVTCGRCDMIVNTMHNTPFTDMNDSEGEVQQAGYAAFDSGGRVIALLTAFLPACKIDAARVSDITDAACITITELADTLVREEGTSFRQAHEIAAATAKSHIAQRIPLGAGFDAFAAAFAEITGRATRMDKENFAASVSAQAFVAKRDRIGGPARPALERALDDLDATRREMEAVAKARRQRRARAREDLNTAFAQLLET